MLKGQFHDIENVSNVLRSVRVYENWAREELLYDSPMFSSITIRKKVSLYMEKLWSKA
jgi:hypothetical protein